MEDKKMLELESMRNVLNIQSEESVEDENLTNISPEELESIKEEHDEPIIEVNEKEDKEEKKSIKSELDEVAEKFRRAQLDVKRISNQEKKMLSDLKLSKRNIDKVEKILNDFTLDEIKKMTDEDLFYIFKRTLIYEKLASSTLKSGKQLSEFVRDVLEFIKSSMVAEEQLIDIGKTYEKHIEEFNKEVEKVNTITTRYDLISKALEEANEHYEELKEKEDKDENDKIKMVLIQEYITGIEESVFLERTKKFMNSNDRLDQYSLYRKKKPLEKLFNNVRKRMKKDTTFAFSDIDAIPHLDVPNVIEMIRFILDDDNKTEAEVLFAILYKDGKSPNKLKKRYSYFNNLTKNIYATYVNKMGGVDFTERLNSLAELSKAKIK